MKEFKCSLIWILLDVHNEHKNNIIIHLKYRLKHIKQNLILFLTFKTN